jgi:multimeric flavodoxin WrbA
MNVLAIDCSARHDGLTARMVQAALEGAAAAGARTEHVALADLTIERCRMCDPNGWGRCRREGQCAIQDDLAAVVTKMEAADRLVFATPVYFGDLSESAKAFTDRVRRMATGRAPKEFLRNLPTVGIAAAGGGGGGTGTCMTNLEKVLSLPGCFVVDLVPVARRNAHYKAEVLRLVGQALVGIQRPEPPR